MTTAIRHRLRAILRRSSTPLTTRDLAERVGESVSPISNALRRMPDAYVASWTVNEQGRCVMEWAVVRVPPNAPKPASGKKPTSGEKICD